MDLVLSLAQWREPVFRKFVANAGVFFCLLLCLCVTMIAFSPYSQEFAFNYEKIRDVNVGKLPWIFQRFHEPIDIACIGSSHTLVGVDDRLVEETIRRQPEWGRLRVANLGRNFVGRNLDYVFAKSLLACQSPRTVFLELQNEFPDSGNPMFPILAQNGDLCDAAGLLTETVFDDSMLVFKSRFDSWFRVDDPLASSSDNRYFRSGYGFMANSDTYRPKMLDNPLIPDRLRELYRTLRHDIRVLGIRSNRHYLRLIVEMARRKRIRLVFLFIPGLNPPVLASQEEQDFPGVEVWKPPLEIFREPANFYDEGHLNTRGAEKFSRWLADRIVADPIMHRLGSSPAWESMGSGSAR